MSDGIRVESDGDVLVVTIDRADKGNALRGADTAAIADAVADGARQQTARAVLIRSDGKHFCTGADLSSDARGGKQSIGGQMRNLPHTAHRLVRTLWDVPLPIVAAVQGRAMGLGLHMALASDFVVAAETATFQEPFSGIGFSGDSGATFLLTRLVGVARAKELLLRGTPVGAPTALEWGLIGQVCPDADLDARARALAAELAAKPTFSVGLSKRLLHRHLTAQIDEALEAEATAVELSIRSDDFKTGIRSFGAKTPPPFSGT